MTLLYCGVELWPDLLGAQHQSPLVFWSLPLAPRYFLFSIFRCVFYTVSFPFYISCSVVCTSYLFKNVRSQYAFFFFSFLVVFVRCT